MMVSKLTKASLLISLTTSSLIFATAASATDPSADSSANTPLTSTSLNKVVNAGQKINHSAAKSQQKVNTLTNQAQTKLQQFHVVTKEVDGLSVYNQQMQAQLDSQMN